MDLGEQLIPSIGVQIQNHQNILIMAHRSPDGDALASILALAVTLRNMGKNALPVCWDPVPKNYHFMPHQSLVKTNFDSQGYSLLIVCDCGNVRKLTGFYDDDNYREIFDQVIGINIDHHPPRDSSRWGKILWIDYEKAATSIMIFELIQFLKAEITPDLATLLLTGIFTDTGGFQHSNTNAEVLAESSLLLSKGADLKTISEKVLRQSSINKLKLWGQVLENMDFDEARALIWSKISRKEIEELGGDYDDLSGIINIMSGVEEAKAAVLLSEKKEGKIKGSVRTKDDFGADSLASLFGGGGHKKAAGFSVPGKIED